MSAMPFRSTKDSLIFKILRIIFVELFVILNLHEDILKGYQRRPEKLNCYMMIILKIYVAVDVFQVPN